VTGRGDQTEAAAVFDPLRPRLLRIAYRMLGSVADAEDIVQEAFIRWHAAERETVRVPEAYLRRVVMRLCLDELKSARARRETYVGPWLPEPLVETEDDEIDDITLPLMMELTAFSARARRLPPARRIRRRFRRGRRGDRARRGVLPPTGTAGARALAGRQVALRRGEGARHGNRAGLLRRLARR